ncbi:FecR family protein [uncultured Caulobacter sp.]|uniref:FecR family protein n=1 Tax=uncultured Caulobacter sp. TaxID=158749 RepID=UPI002613DB02|nr:FecR domain-containing protein [uncultured Caulobacter sp.]
MTISPEEGLPDPGQLLAASLTRPLTASEQAYLDAWAASSATAREEIARTREAWMALGLAAEDPAVRAMRQAARREAGLDRVAAPRSLVRRLVIAGLGLAVAAALAVGVTLSTRVETRVFTAPDHAAAHLTLTDGSRVTLSPGGRLESRFTLGARDVALRKGDAYFEVAHNARRPFTVAASGRTLTVLGTRFNVAGGRRLTVSLVEGSLRVSQAGAPSVVLRPGERYVETAPAAGAVQAGDVAGDAAWTSGRVVLTGATLAQAAERLSRAAGRRVELTDPALSNLRLSGSLRIERMSDVAAGLEALLPVKTRLTREGDLFISPGVKSS